MRLIARSAVWRFVEFGAGECLAFVFMIILTRLLTPAEYGIVAIASMIVLLAQLIIRYGLVEALVQCSELTSVTVCTAFSINLALGIGLSLGLVGLAEPMAKLTGNPDLTEVLSVLAWLSIPQSVVWIYVALLRRSLNFRGLALRAGFAILISSLVAVGMALSGFGIWSLVAMQVVNALVSVVVVIVSTGWLPSHWPKLATARTLMRTALPLMAAGAVGTTGWALPTLAFGVTLPAAVVGHFFIAQRVMLSLNGLCTASVGDLSLSVLARLQGSVDQHRTAARHALRLGGLVCLPAFAGVCMTAEPMVLAFFGDQWADSILPLRLLMASSVSIAAAFITGQILLSFGYHRLVLRLNVMAVLPPALVTSALAPLGLVPALIGNVAVSSLSLVVVIRSLCQILSARPTTLLGDQLPTLVAVAALIFALLGVELSDLAMSPIKALLFEASLGALVFVVVLVWLDPKFCRLVVDSVTGTRHHGTAQGG